MKQEPRTRVFESLYKHKKGDTCTYCGEPAEEKDHAPPIKWMKLKQPAFFKERKIPLLVVPSCFECNRTLGGKELFTIEERQLFIYQHLAVNEYDLRMQEPHSMQERKEFSGRLREEIRAHLFQQVRAWRRYEFAQKKAK